MNELPASSSIGGLLSWADGVVLFGLLVVLVAVGLYFRRQQTSTAEFFLGGRNLPGWAACLSFVATEVSAVTIISVPAVAYSENWNYLQFFIGSALARVVLATLFIPAFYKFQCTTIYEFLGARFGVLTQRTAALFFFVTRLLGSGVRLMAACLALSVLFNWPMAPVIAGFILVSAIYMATGGIRAVVWTNVLQALVILGGGTAAVVFIFTHIPGGWTEGVRLAREAGRLAVFHGGPAFGEPGFWGRFFSDPNIIWVAVLNGFVGSLAAFGTDQDLMQRLLTVETRRKSQRTMLGTIPVSLLTLVIHLSIGAGLYAFYASHPGAAVPEKSDKIFPFFIGHHMPVFLKGLLLSSIVLASVDSPLTSLATAFVVDFYRPWRDRRGAALPGHYLWVSRWSVGAFGIILGLLAYGFSFFDKILWLAFKIGGVTFGSLLGVFLLGLLTARRADRANVAAMGVSAAGMAVLLALSERGVIPLGWSWLVILGTVVTFGTAYGLAPVMDREGAGRG
jgi:SSS family transporter